MYPDHDLCFFQNRFKKAEMVGKIHPDHEELKVDVLIKKSQGKSFVTFEGYQERVFVLDKECLTYYEGNLQVLV